MLEIKSEPIHLLQDMADLYNLILERHLPTPIFKETTLTILGRLAREQSFVSWQLVNLQTNWDFKFMNERF